MISLKKQKGFTIVELLIVMVIIAILATLVIVTFTGIQQKARNTQRDTDINAVDAHLEAYYAENGSYPTLANLQDPTWISANMKGLDPSALADPKTPSSDITSTSTGIAGSASTNPYQYGYTVTPSGCDNDTTPCTSFTLTANLEGGGTFTKSSNT